MAPSGSIVRRPPGTLSIYRVTRVSQEPEGRLDGWLTILPGARDAALSHGSGTIYKMVTISNRAFWQRAVLPLLKSLYPRLAPLYFMQREIRDSLGVLRSALPNGLELSLVRASIRERIGLRSSAQGKGRRRYRSDVVYTQEDLDLAFQVAQDRGQWFKTITVEIDSGRDTPAQAVTAVTVCKDGWTSWNSVALELDVVLDESLIHEAEGRLHLFSDRGLRSRNYEPASPISLDFESSIFEDRRAVRTLAATLLRYPHAAKAVLHENPYLHMTMSDDRDGSACDVWVLSPRRILLVPGLQASESALNRLVNHIVENFRDARVSEYAEDAE